MGWVHCHVARQPRPFEQVRPSLSRPLIDIVGKLLAKLPDHRYQSAQGLHHDLERCLREWNEHRPLGPFPLGERDISETFRIPQKLYGRDVESAVLREAFERAAEYGTSELVLVSGYAGIGKSALVRELVRTIVKALQNSDNGTLRDDFFRDLLRRGFTTADTEAQLDVAIDWGRYGELFDYDADSGELVLSEVAAALAAGLAGLDG